MTEKVRILVAEDEEELRETLSSHLSGEGYEVETAVSGYEAIPLIHGKKFDVVILDLKMPYIDGFEVLKFLKGTFPSTKVIVLTAYTDLKNIQECKRLGANEIYGKPYNLEDLFTTIARLIKE